MLLCLRGSPGHQDTSAVRGWRGPALRGGGAKNRHRRRVTRGGGQALAEVGPSAAKARPASTDATVEERLGEGQLSRNAPPATDLKGEDNDARRSSG